MYFKDFDNWNENKKLLQEEKKEVFFYEREIRWCFIGVNLGNEIDGKSDNFERPVLVFKKFNNTTLWILPLTGKPKYGKYYYSFFWKNRNQSVVLSQLKLISVKRLGRRMGVLNKKEFSKIKAKFKELL